MPHIMCQYQKRKSSVNLIPWIYQEIIIGPVNGRDFDNILDIMLKTSSPELAALFTKLTQFSYKTTL